MAHRARDDGLCAAISEGRRFAGMEHWLPFYYERLDTLFDYLPGAPVVFDHLAHEAIDERHKLILDYYEARRQQAGSALKDAVPYKPTPPGLIYLSPDDVTAALAEHLARRAHALRHTRRRPAHGAARRLRAPATTSPRSAPIPTPMSSTRW